MVIVWPSLFGLAPILFATPKELPRANLRRFGPLTHFYIFRVLKLQSRKYGPNTELRVCVRAMLYGVSQTYIVYAGWAVPFLHTY